MATQTDTRVAPKAQPFDPATWLAAFEQVGGGYVANENRFALMHQIEGSPREHQQQVCRMISGLTADDRSALRAHLTGEHLNPTGSADTAILAAWQARAEAFERYNALPFSETPGAPYTPEEAAEWAIIDRAEEVLRSAVATTPAGVAAQLWTALGHMVTNKAHDDAALDRDLAAFDLIDAELDWTVRMVLAALRSLKAMEG